VIRHRYPLAEAAQVHRDLEGRKTVGSIVMVAERGDRAASSSLYIP
jgi:hypothetical protein